MRALITGVYWQDGSYLCEQLRDQGYEVHGICHSVLSDTSKRIRRELEIENKLPIEHYESLYDYDAMERLILHIQPDEIYHMAAIHNSAESADNNLARQECQLLRNNITATQNILSACSQISCQTRIATAGSCLMFDYSDTVFQNEATQFEADSMYGIAKITERQLVEYYRHRGLYASMAILYNHESHRRGERFVTRKISKGLRDIINGKVDSITLGGIDALKDWGYAGDYMKAMRLMLKADEPKDYILATGKLHSIEEFVSECAKQLHVEDWRKYIKIDEKMISRKIKGTLRGDASKIRQELGWEPEMDFGQLVTEMITDGGRIRV